MDVQLRNKLKILGYIFIKYAIKNTTAYPNFNEVAEFGNKGTQKIMNFGDKLASE